MRKSKNDAKVVKKVRAEVSARAAARGFAGGGNARGHRWAVMVQGWQPARLNEYVGRHWAVGARKKKFDRELVAACCLGAGVPRAEGKRRVGLVIQLGPRQKGGDPDSYWKTVLDALVACGALVNDNKEGVELLPVEYTRGATRATIILLEEVHVNNVQRAEPRVATRGQSLPRNLAPRSDHSRD